MPVVKLLTFTSLFPNTVKPAHGIFVEQRLRHLLDSNQVAARIIAPVPWFPFRHALFGKYALLAQVPYQEQRENIDVLHPRYPVLPKIGMLSAPFLLAATMTPVLRGMINNGYDFDLIDAHYFYPDGVAAVLLGRYFRKPVVVTARGTDINLVPRYALPRRMILWAAGRAAGIITVCQALKDALLELGVAEKKIVVLRNGVDPQVFHPIDRQAWRARLGLNEISLLSVGELIKRKGHDIAIKALQKLPRVRLLIAGDGVEEQALRSLARSLGVAGRVTFLGPVPHCELTNYYGAADALVLASSREGLANVLLEAMACGTPVIASNVWGTPELVHSPEAGVLMAERSPGALVQAYHALFANYPDHRATARYAQRFTWEETTRGQLSLFRRILQQRPAA